MSVSAKNRLGLTDLAALAAALEHAGICDPMTRTPFTETRLYGLSGGPGFASFMFQYKGMAPIVTLTCRSYASPGPVVDRALQYAGVEVERIETGSVKKAQEALDDSLSQGAEVHLAVDQAQLPWLGIDAQWKGQWPRHINVLGREGDGYAVFDRAKWHLSTEALGAARAGVKKVKHRALTFAEEATNNPAEATIGALMFYIRNMREAPFTGFANNFGLAGLKRLAEVMEDGRTKRGWARMFGSGPYAFGACLRVWECVMMELTAPAGGRLLFADFLDEARDLPGLKGLGAAGHCARDSGAAFEALAAVAARCPLMEEAISLTQQIDTAQGSGDETTPETVLALRAERDALGERCEWDADERGALFGEFAAAVRAIRVHELRMVEAVEAVLR